MNKIKGIKIVDRAEILNFLSQELNNPPIHDYCPNGLQVEGKTHISRIISGVTASYDLIQQAIIRNADAIFVHHGYFWRGEDPCIVGYKQKRIRLLLEHNINLISYHLPLDLHPNFGNNIQLAKVLGFTLKGHFGEHNLGCIGEINDPAVKTVADLITYVANKLGRKPIAVGDLNQPIGNVAWCTGAAQKLLVEASLANASVYLSGEISEQTFHEAKECGIAYLACGHHATERYGIQALGQLLANHFGIFHEFIDIENPV